MTPNDQCANDAREDDAMPKAASVTINATDIPQVQRLAMSRYRRHPAEVTSDRLADALDKWPDRFDGRQRDAVAEIRTTLEDIAEAAGGE